MTVRSLASGPTDCASPPLSSGLWAFPGGSRESAEHLGPGPSPSKSRSLWLPHFGLARRAQSQDVGFRRGGSAPAAGRQRSGTAGNEPVGPVSVPEVARGPGGTSAGGQRPSGLGPALPTPNPYPGSQRALKFRAVTVPRGGGVGDLGTRGRRPSRPHPADRASLGRRLLPARRPPPGPPGTRPPAPRPLWLQLSHPRGAPGADQPFSHPLRGRSSLGRDSLLCEAQDAEVQNEVTGTVTYVHTADRTASAKL